MNKRATNEKTPARGQRGALSWKTGRSPFAGIASEAVGPDQCPPNFGNSHVVEIKAVASPRFQRRNAEFGFRNRGQHLHWDIVRRFRRLAITKPVGDRQQNFNEVVGVAAIRCCDS